MDGSILSLEDDLVAHSKSGDVRIGTTSGTKISSKQSCPSGAKLQHSLIHALVLVVDFLQVLVDYIFLPATRTQGVSVTDMANRNRSNENILRTREVIREPSTGEDDGNLGLDIGRATNRGDVGT